MKKTKNKTQDTKLVHVDQPGVMGVFERLARNPALTVDKLEKLIALQMTIREVDAKQAFDEAYEAMALEIPTITKRGKVRNKQGEVQSHYAKFEDIMRVVKPVLKRFGFTLHFRTEWPDSQTLEVVGILTHRGGHSRESRFRSPADATGGKNSVQGLGSARSYGDRYTVIDLLCIICEGVDDDGQTAPSRRRDAQEPPAESRRRDNTPAGKDTRSPVERGEEFPYPEFALPVDQKAPPARQAPQGETITDPQRRRFHAIRKSSGRSEEEVKGWLKRRYGLDSTADIRRSDYDAITKAVEATGDLP